MQWFLSCTNDMNHCIYNLHDLYDRNTHSAFCRNSAKIFVLISKWNNTECLFFSTIKKEIQNIQFTMLASAQKMTNVQNCLGHCAKSSQYGTCSLTPIAQTECNTSANVFTLLRWSSYIEMYKEYILQGMALEMRIKDVGQYYRWRSHQWHWQCTSSAAGASSLRGTP